MRCKLWKKLQDEEFSDTFVERGFMVRQYLVGIFLLIASFSNQALATITIVSSSATSTTTSGSTQSFYWPIQETSATGKNYCAASSTGRLYPTTLSLLDPTSTSTSVLRFKIISDTTKDAKTRYVHAQFKSNNNLLVMSGGGTHAVYGEADTEVVFNLSSFCSSSNGITSECQFTEGSLSAASVEVYIGITDDNGELFDTSSSNDATEQDYTTIKIVPTRCATLDESTTYYTSAAPPADKYYYEYTVSPRDGGAKINILTSPPAVVNNIPYKSTLIIFQASNTALTSSTLLSSATKIVEISGTPTGEVVVGDLVNDTTYNVQIAYVNAAGFVTPPGHPSTGGTAQALQVTPSRIDGALAENACFVATAAFGVERNATLKIFRQFRDQILTKFQWGQEFIQWYYSWSVNAAQQIEENDWIKPVIRLLLWPVALIAAFSVWVKTHESVVLIVFSLIIPLSMFLIAYIRHSKRKPRP